MFPIHLVSSLVAAALPQGCSGPGPGVLGNGVRHLGTLLERLYDLPLFLPLWLEAKATGSVAPTRAAAREA